MKHRDRQAQATYTSFHQFASVMLSRAPRLATSGEECIWVWCLG